MLNLIRIIVGITTSDSTFSSNALKAQILAFDRHIMAWHRSNETSKQLDAIPGSALRWRLLWSRALVILRRFDRVGISRPGSGSYRSRTQAAAKTSSATSANKAIDIYAVYSPPVLSP
jgi:hypothetical protein